MPKLLRFLLWTAVIVGALIFGLRYFAIRWWRVPDNDPFLEASIAPTIRGGDLIILWRLTAASFGDLVLCPEPGAPERVVIGRIAGEAGDKIHIEQNRITLNNKPIGTERACDDFTVNEPNYGREVKQHCDVEIMGGKNHLRGSTAGQKNLPKTFERSVTEGNVFLVSDNRLFPYDSRDYGLVERSTCKEMVVFRLISKDGFQDQPNRFTAIQ
jgi:signal peptidase I